MSLPKYSSCIQSYIPPARAASWMKGAVVINTEVYFSKHCFFCTFNMGRHDLSNSTDVFDAAVIVIVMFTALFIHPDQFLFELVVLNKNTINLDGPIYQD